MSEKKYIEMAWKSYRHMVIPPEASEAQVKETRQAFYAGVCILFETLMLVLEPGEKETVADMQVMADLQTEITEFGLELDLNLLPVGGHG